MPNRLAPLPPAPLQEVPLHLATTPAAGSSIGPAGEISAELSGGLVSAFQSLPVQGLVPAALALGMGVLLWWFGERLLRLAMMVVAVFVGVPLGMMLGAAFAPALPALAAAIAGAVVLLIAAAVGLRFAVAGGLAIVFGLASFLGAIVAVEQGWIDATGPLAGQAEVSQASFHGHGDISPIALSIEDSTDPDSGGVTADAGDTASAWGDLLASMLYARDWAGERWTQLPAAGRTLAGAAAAIGLVVGFGLGLVFQRTALQIATAVFGSLLILSGGTTLLGWLAPEWIATTLPGGPWLGLWGVLSVVGAIVQWKRAATNADEE